MLGGESSWSTSVSESAVVEKYAAVGGLAFFTMPTPDEADVGAGGKIVAESGV